MEDNRKIKFKTFDNQISEMTVPSNILISELKKMIQKTKQMPVESQRLIFKGKLMTDNQSLSDHIIQDNEIIHLMCKTPENSNQNQNQGTQSQPNQQQTGFNGAPMFSILGNMLNPNNIMQMTNMIFGENGQNFNIINTTLNQSMNQPQSSNINTTTNQSQLQQQQQQHQPQETIQHQPQETIQLPITQSSVRNSTLSQPQPQTTTSSSEQQSMVLNRNCLYPIALCESDARYNNFLKNINQSLDSFSNTINPNPNPNNQLPSLPPLNTTQNVLTSISRSLRYYSLTMTQFLPILNRLIDLLEREQFITNLEDRKKNNELIKMCANALEKIGKSSISFNSLLKETNFGNTPNTGFVNVTSRNTQNIINESQISEPNEQSNPPPQNNIFGNIMNQLFRPENLSNIVGMVQTMSGNQNGNNNNNTNTSNTNTNTNSNNQGHQNNFFGNLMSNLMSSIQDEMDVDENELPQRTTNTNTTGQIQQSSQPQRIQQSQLPISQPIPQTQQPIKIETPKELLIRILNDPSLKQTTHLDEVFNAIKINPHQDFADFSTQIISHLTFQEVTDLYELNIKGFICQRESIFKLLSSSSKQALISKLTELITERIILIENEIDKLKPNQSFEIEPLLNNHFTRIVDILLNNTISSEKWEGYLKKAIMVFLKELFLLLTNQYQSGHEGAMFCFAFNFEGILSEIVGKEMINAFKAVDTDGILNVTEHIIDLSFNDQYQVNIEMNKQEEESLKEIYKVKEKEKISNIVIEEKKVKQSEEVKESTEQHNEREEESSNIQIGSVFIDMEEVFKVAMKDKSRLAEHPQESIKFSELYYRTSLFQE